ncbi:MAG: heat-inducible transcriptional repressor HrcA [Oscillospiraceae bacterium]
MDISRRKSLILEKIVALYTDSGDPVGSKILNRFLEDISVSSATIRNEMAELTSLGYLEQPHTSAGRVPTVEGLRYYVEHLLQSHPLTAVEQKYIDESVDGMDSDPDRAADEAARTLAMLTGLAAITTTPKGGNVQLTHYEIFKTGKYNIAIVGVSSVGGVKTRVCRVVNEFDNDMLAMAENLLNKVFVFVSPEDLSESLIENVYAELGKNAKLCVPIIAAVVAIIKSASDVRVYTEGQEKLLNYHEFDSHIKELLELFSDTENMRNRLEPDESLKVYVGDEPGAFGMDSLGVVTGRYRAAGGRYGALAVAGPIRMNYGFIIPRVAYFRDRLSAALTNPGI